MPEEIKDLRSQSHFDAETAKMVTLLEKQQEEIKDHGATSAATSAEIKSVGDRFVSISDETKAYDARIKKLEAKLQRQAGAGGAGADIECQAGK